jgi:hypothetical protein
VEHAKHVEKMRLQHVFRQMAKGSRGTNGECRNAERGYRRPTVGLPSANRPCGGTFCTVTGIARSVSRTMLSIQIISHLIKLLVFRAESRGDAIVALN